nr:hypothetical protein [Kofleriaceae bacterium]
ATAVCLILHVGPSTAEPVAPGSRVVVRQDQVLFATKDEATRSAVGVARPGNQTMSLEVVADYGDVVEVRTEGSKNECVPGYRGLGGYTGRVVVRVFVAKRELLPRLRANQVRMFPDHTGYALTAGTPMLAGKGGFTVLGLNALPPPLFDSAAVVLGVVPSVNVATLPDHGQALVCDRDKVMTAAQAQQEQQQAEADRLQECRRKSTAATPAVPTASKKTTKKSKAPSIVDEAAAFADLLMAEDRCDRVRGTDMVRSLPPQYCALPPVLHVGGVAVLDLTAVDRGFGQRPREHDGGRTVEVQMNCVALRVPMAPPEAARATVGGLGGVGTGRGGVEAPPYEAWGAFTWPDGKPAGKVDGKGRLQLSAANVQLQAGALCTQLPNLSQPVCFAKKNYQRAAVR